jgi:hypothetical protein
MLRLKDDTASAHAVVDLSRQIADLRRAIRSHEADISC